MITEEDIKLFVEKCQALTDSLTEPGYYRIGFESLKKNYRIFHDYGQGAGRSLHCFVDKETGDVYKGSWKAVVKNGRRGNIFEPDISRFMDRYGTRYLR